MLVQIFQYAKFDQNWDKISNFMKIMIIALYILAKSNANKELRNFKKNQN